MLCCFLREFVISVLAAGRRCYCGPVVRNQSHPAGFGHVDRRGQFREVARLGRAPVKYYSVVIAYVRMIHPATHWRRYIAAGGKLILHTECEVARY